MVCIMSITFWPSGCCDDELSLNVANGNAYIPAMMMGTAVEEGTVPVHMLEAALDSVQQQCEADYLRPTRTHAKEGYATVIEFGTDWEQVARYKRALVEMLNYCIEHQTSLVWG